MSLKSSLALAMLTAGLLVNDVASSAPPPSFEHKDGEWTYKVRAPERSSTRPPHFVSIEGSHPDGRELNLLVPVPDLEALARGQDFEAESIANYRECNTAFSKQPVVRFGEGKFTAKFVITKADMARCPQLARDVHFSFEIPLGPEQRTKLLLPRTAAAFNSCKAEPGPSLQDSEYSGRDAMVGTPRETPLTNAMLYGRLWWRLVVTTHKQTGPQRFAAEVADAWSYGDQIQILSAEKNGAWSRPILKVRRKSDGKEAFMSANDVIVGDISSCTPEVLGYKGIRFLAKRAPEAQIVDDGGNWITDPNIKYGICADLSSDGIVCKTAAYPGGQGASFPSWTAKPAELSVLAQPPKQY